MTDTESRPTAARTRPRIRTAAIVWGLIVAAVGAIIGWFVLDPARVTSVQLAVLSAEPRMLAVGGVALLLVIGVVIVIGSLLHLVHRAQDRGRARSEERAAAPAAPDSLPGERT